MMMNMAAPMIIPKPARPTTVKTPAAAPLCSRKLVDEDEAVAASDTVLAGTIELLAKVPLIVV